MKSAFDAGVENMIPRHIEYLRAECDLKTNEGKLINVLKLDECTNDEVLSKWAIHLRKHYCSDSEIDRLRKGYGYSRKEYLENIKFPNLDERGGASTRSGDFSEILVADYVEFILQYFVPRTRYDRKVRKNSSTQGSDVLGFKSKDKASKDDELIVFEVKAQARNAKSKNKLQEAVNDSNKDVKRIATSLNAIVQRLYDKDLSYEAEKVQRFQNATDRPYKQIYGAAAVHSEKSYSETLLKEVKTNYHIDPNVELLVIYSKDLMDTIHKLYERACECD